MSINGLLNLDIDLHHAVKSSKKAEECDEEAEASEVAEEVFETASEVEDVDLSVAADNNTDELETVRANLQDWVNKRVLNKTGE